MYNTSQCVSPEQYHPLESKIKRVIERELTTIVEEEKLVSYPLHTFYRITIYEKHFLFSLYAATITS